MLRWMLLKIFPIPLKLCVYFGKKRENEDCQVQYRSYSFNRTGTSTKLHYHIPVWHRMKTNCPTVCITQTLNFFLPFSILPLVTILGSRSGGKKKCWKESINHLLKILTKKKKKNWWNSRTSSDCNCKYQVREI